MFLCPKWAGYLEFFCPKCKSSSPKCETVSEVWETTANRAKPASRVLKPEEIEKAEVIWMEETLDGQALPVGWSPCWSMARFAMMRTATALASPLQAETEKSPIIRWRTTERIGDAG